MSKKKILIVEDEKIVSLSLKIILKRLGYDVIGETSTGKEAIDICLNNEPDIIIMDIGLSGEIDGIETAKQIKRICNIPVIFLTGNIDSETFERAKFFEPFGYLIKPFDEDEILTTLEMFLSPDKKRTENTFNVSEDQSAMLNEIEARYKSLVRYSRDAIFICDARGKILMVSPVCKEILGYSADDFVHDSKLPSKIITPEYKNKFNDFMSDFLKGYLPDKPVEWAWIGKDGKIVFTENTYSMVTDEIGNKNIGFQIIARDITERKKNEESLKASLREKEILLKEIHHRVKNNMQIISSLLNLQAVKIQEPLYKDLFIHSQNRIKSMAMIHESLYRSRDFSKINFGDYLKNLTSFIIKTFGKVWVSIKIEIDNIHLDIETAVPCGLIINELVSNSLKYAFEKPENGAEIKITLLPYENKYFMLIVQDNGVGFPKDIDFKNTDSLGFQLVNSLVYQIDGTIQLENDNGSKFIITFENKSHIKNFE